MTLNKWTVALASAGIVSLASVAQAEEKTTMSVSSLTPTTISGYVDTSAQWNPGTGDMNLPEYRFGGPSKADGFNLNVVQLRIEKPLDEAEWAAGYRVDLWAGPDANTLGTQTMGVEGDFAIRQAYVALRMPVGNGIDWKVGVFDSIIGYESVEGPSNPNFTRSYGNTIEPTTHTGILASYRFSDLISASAGVANTVGPTINERAFYVSGNPYAESYKTYMGSVALTAPESMGFLAGSTLYGGVVNGFSSSYDMSQINWYVGATFATPVTGLRLGVAFDDLDVYNLSGETWAIGGYASYQASEKLSLHVRGEYLRDRGDQSFFGDTMPGKTLALTGTIQYDLWKNVLSRLEVRWDHALDGNGTWGGTTPTSGDEVNAVMIAANFVYKF